MSLFVMPSLGADMTAGTLVEQLVPPGGTVKHGDIVAAVETQKGVIEIEAFQDGILDSWLVELGAKVPVGTPLARITTAQDASASDASAQPAPDKPEVPKPAVHAPKPERREKPIPQEPEIAGPKDGQKTPAMRAEPRQRITPAARRLAAQAGIDPSTLSPEGTSPTISRADIAALVTTPLATPVSDMRSAIAAAMSRSKREIPHYYLSHQADLTNAEAFVTETNAQRPPDKRILLGALFLKAMTLAVRTVPEMNGHFENGSFAPSKTINAGLAINLRGGGLVAPAILQTDALNLDDLMVAMRDLVTRVRAGRFRSRELSDATITLTSLGDRGVNQLFGVIYPPQVAIVGIGTPVLRPWVHDGKVAPRLIADITLAADHRVSDGRRGAMFLRTIAENLHKPEAL